jgi:hypothetical protein
MLNHAIEFCDWLNKQGHDAKIGTSTRNYIDGYCTSHNDDMNMVMNEFWNEFSCGEKHDA